MKAFTTARLGNDMEVRFLQDGTPVGQLSLAVRLGIKDKSSGEYRTQWVSASMFGKRVESLAPYLKKGSLHAFHLRDIHLDEYEKDGVKRASMKATIDDVELCGKSENVPVDNQPKPAQKANVAKATFDPFDDDVAF